MQTRYRFSTNDIKEMCGGNAGVTVTHPAGSEHPLVRLLEVMSKIDPNKITNCDIYIETNE